MCQSNREEDKYSRNEKGKDATKMTGREPEYSSEQCDMQGSRLDQERKWMAGRQVHS